MASPAAIGGGALGAAAIGVGGAYLAGAFEGKGDSEVEVEPNRVLLVNETDFSSVYSTADWIGKEYKNYLVAPIGSKGEGNLKTDNQKWWEWSYKRWQADSGKTDNDLSDEFKNKDKVSSDFSDSTATSNTSPKALNKVCEAVYKQNKSTITTLESSPDNQSRLKRDLFKYCSVLGEVKTISEAKEAYGSNTKGKEDANVKKFVAVNGNDKFWQVRNEEFYTDGDGDKSKSKVTDNSSNEFKVKSSENSRSEIRVICKEAYESGTTDTQNYPSADVEKFCTL
ncbi:hypothetical protein [Candidatus Mycoplasma haematohominis]|uniref:hypothetical protein n=1 Tax=Candidatus Mycoplasma haematohominis TaxID=1494318 RepID=UPI001C0A69A0|nr:hypothetical protein [Candidatus Mycoplasma haemohominis]